MSHNKKILLLFLLFLSLTLASGAYLRRQSDSAAQNIAANQPATIINQNGLSANPTASPEPSFPSNISSNPIKEIKGKNSQDAAPQNAPNETLPSSLNTSLTQPLASKTPERNGEWHSLYVGEKKYAIAVPANQTVYDLMAALKQRGDFDFQGKNSRGLGFFVEEINGVRNNPKESTFWIYYINGKGAELGISNYTLKINDIITWKYEKTQY